MNEPYWTGRLSQVGLRTNIETKCATLMQDIEALGANEDLTEALLCVENAMCHLGRWHDNGEPGKS